MPELQEPKLYSSQLIDRPEQPEPVLPYAELITTTNFSFLRGASHADELVNQAAHLGYRAIGVADLNTFAGIVRMHQAAKHAGIKLPGSSFVFARFCFLRVRRVSAVNRPTP